MHRIDTVGANLGAFVDKNPATGTPGTVVDAEWLNGVQEELAGLIEKEGVALDKNNRGQLVEVISRRRTKVVASLLAMIQHDIDENLHVVALFAGDRNGMGTYRYDSARPRPDANGDDIIDPVSIGGFDGTEATYAAYLAAQGLGAGSGCWVRVHDTPARYAHDVASIARADLSDASVVIVGWHDVNQADQTDDYLVATGDTYETQAGTGENPNGFIYDAKGNEFRRAKGSAVKNVTDRSEVESGHELPADYVLGEQVIVQGGKVLAPNSGKKHNSWRLSDTGVDATTIGTYAGWYDNQPYIYLNGSRQSIQCAKDGMGRFGEITLHILYQESGINQPVIWSDYTDAANKLVLSLESDGVILEVAGGTKVTLCPIDIRGGAHTLVFSLSKRTGYTCLIVDGVVWNNRIINLIGIVANTTKSNLMLGESPDLTSRGFTGHLRARIWMEAFPVAELRRIGLGRNPRRPSQTYSATLPAARPFAPGSVDTYRGKEIIDLFLIYGQSNAQGSAEISSLISTRPLQISDSARQSLVPPAGAYRTPYPTHQSVYIYDAANHAFRQFHLRNNHWMGNETLDRTKFGPEVELANRLVTEARKAVIHKTTKSGTSLAVDWDPAGSNNMYTLAVGKLQACIDDLVAQGYYPIVRGLIWAQGERDCKDDLAPSTYYSSKLNTLIANIRTTIRDKAISYSVAVAEGAADVFPVVIVKPKIGPSLVAAYPLYADVHAAQAAVAAASPHVYLLDTADNTIYPQTDDLHFNSTGQVNIGSACFDVFDGH